MKKAGGIILFMILIATSTFAHDLVLIPEDQKSVTIKFGHPQEFEAPDPDKLIRLNAYFDGEDAMGLCNAEPQKAPMIISPSI
ncbi:MAG: hypothetical protein JO138_03995 [Acidobacteriaceae bacterium]|nr:hypothetical protein [Acidobacteriaceae bacterium]